MCSNCCSALSYDLADAPRSIQVCQIPPVRFRDLYRSRGCVQLRLTRILETFLAGSGLVQSFANSHTGTRYQISEAILVKRMFWIIGTTGFLANYFHYPTGWTSTAAVKLCRHVILAQTLVPPALAVLPISGYPSSAWQFSCRWPHS